LRKELSYFDMKQPRKYVEELKKILAARPLPPLAFVQSYGCQQSVSDGERIKGLLAEIGYGFTDSPENADLILYNTCAVRENAEQRVYGNVGALKHYKKANPSLIIAVTGCMTQQETAVNKFRNSYPYVDIILGTNACINLPELLWKKISKTGKPVTETKEYDDTVYEDIPVRRDGSVKAYVPVMYGCDNFCSYCVVPLVRGRERSRSPQKVIEEIKGLVADGCKDITLLGQNVNSYGKGLPEKINFAELLRQADAIPGDFRIRFMTSHPKDCTQELIDAMAQCSKVCKHLHLPAQSGSNRVLKEMNRKYTAEDYLKLIELARERIPDISLTGDIMVGFPGETYEDFLMTLDLVKKVQYSALFTFIYSKRSGTKASQMPDEVSDKEKSRWFRELLEVQGAIGEEKLKKYVGRELRVLIEGEGRTPGTLTGRSDDNTIVEVEGELSLIGEFVQVKIEKAMNWALRGRIFEK